MKPRDALGWSIVVIAILLCTGVDCQIDGKHYSLHPVRSDSGCKGGCQ